MDLNARVSVNFARADVNFPTVTCVSELWSGQEKLSDGQTYIHTDR